MLIELCILPTVYANSRARIFGHRTLRRGTVHRKKKCWFRLGKVRFILVRFFFLTTKCPTAENLRAANSTPPEYDFVYKIMIHLLN